MRMLGFHVGKDTYIGPNLRMAVGLADTTMQLYIGDRVTIAINDTFVFASKPAPVNSRLRAIYPPPPRKMSIGDDTWIGANVVVLPNVSIGKCCVIGAGAVVTHDIPDYSVAVGVPAKVVKKIDPNSL